MRWPGFDGEIELEALSALGFVLGLSTLVLTPVFFALSQSLPGAISLFENAAGALGVLSLAAVGVGLGLSAWKARRAVTRQRLAQLAMDTTDFEVFGDLGHRGRDDPRAQPAQRGRDSPRR